MSGSQLSQLYDQIPRTDNLREENGIPDDDFGGSGSHSEPHCCGVERGRGSACSSSQVVSLLPLCPSADWDGSLRHTQMANRGASHSHRIMEISWR